MKSVLIATDLSSIARNATEYAIETVKVAPGPVILFHLFKVSSHTADSLIGTRGIDAMFESRKKEMEAYAASLSQKHGIPATAVVRMGDFLDEIKTVYQENNCRILVLGMPQKTFEQDLLGNTTTAAIYTLEFPILAIPQTAMYKGIKKILFACDLAKEIQDSVIEKIKEFALLYGSEVEILYVSNTIDSVSEKEHIKQTLVDIVYRYKREPPSESIIQTILSEAEAISADMIIMTPNKYGFWSSLLHRSKTRAMASNGRLPLLSLPY